MRFAATLLRIGVVLLVAATFGVGAFTLGARSVERDDGVVTPLPAPLDAPSALALDLAELELPRCDLEGYLPWRGVVTQIEWAFERHGLQLELDQANATLARLRSAGSPEALAAMLDGLAEAARHAELEPVRTFASKLAHELDPDSTRQQLRDAIAAGDAVAIRALAGDLDAEQLPARTATLLGAALLRCGETADALDVWRTAALEHPREVVLHRLLAWRLANGEAAEEDEARRHLDTTRAILPTSERARHELEKLDQ